MIYDNIVETIGRTPMIRLHTMAGDLPVQSLRQM